MFSYINALGWPMTREKKQGNKGIYLDGVKLK